MVSGELDVRAGCLTSLAATWSRCCACAVTLSAHSPNHAARIMSPGLRGGVTGRARVERYEPSLVRCLPAEHVCIGTGTEVVCVPSERSFVYRLSIQGHERERRTQAYPRSCSEAVEGRSALIRTRAGLSPFPSVHNGQYILRDRQCAGR